MARAAILLICPPGEGASALLLTDHGVESVMPFLDPVALWEICGISLRPSAV
jgi:hypothetical protein